MAETAVATVESGQQTPSWLQNIPDDILNRELARRTNTSLKEFMHAQREINDQNNLRMNQLEQNIEETAKKMFFIQSKLHSSEYMSRVNLGLRFNPTISSQRMTKLLIYAGILTAGGLKVYEHWQRSKTDPLCVIQKVVRENGAEYNNFKFHCERTWKIIFKQLTLDNKIAKFHACKNKPEIDSFIDSLFEERKNETQY